MISNDYIFYLWVLIPIIFNTCILFFIAQKDKSRTKYSKFLLRSQIFNFGLIIGTFFIPTYNANNISINDDLPLLYTLGFVYVTIFFFPYIVTHGLALTLYGLKYRTHYGDSLFIAGIMMLVHYISVYLWIYFHGVVYMQSPILTWAIYSWFLYNFWVGFIIISIIGYIFLLKHGLKNNFKSFQIFGLVGIGLTLTIELYELLAFFNIIKFFLYYI